MAAASSSWPARLLGHAGPHWASDFETHAEVREPSSTPPITFESLRLPKTTSLIRPRSCAAVTSSRRDRRADRRRGIGRRRSWPPRGPSCSRCRCADRVLGPLPPLCYDVGMLRLRLPLRAPRRLRRHPPTSSTTRRARLRARASRRRARSILAAFAPKTATARRTRDVSSRTPPAPAATARRSPRATAATASPSASATGTLEPHACPGQVTPGEAPTADAGCMVHLFACGDTFCNVDDEYCSINGFRRRSLLPVSAGCVPVLLCDCITMSTGPDCTCSEDATGHFFVSCIGD